MANYFTQFSFVIPMTPEQRAWFMQVHELATTLIAYAEDTPSQHTGEAPPDVMSAALKIAEGRDLSPCAQVACDDEDGTIWVGSEDSGDVDYVGDLVQAFLKRFALDLVVAFQWACTCDRPRLDGFGGGAMVITRRSLASFNSGAFVDTAVKAVTERLRLKPDEELPDLDDVVHDIASSLASDANNGSIGAQLDFLFEHGWNPSEHLLREVVP